MFLRNKFRRRRRRRISQDEKTTLRVKMVLVFPGDRIRLLSSSSPEGKDGEEDFEEIECGSGAYRDENGIKRASKIGEIYVKDVFEDDVLAVDEEDEDEEDLDGSSSDDSDEEIMVSTHPIFTRTSQHINDVF